MDANEQEGEVIEIAPVYRKYLQRVGLFVPFGEKLAVWKIVVCTLYFQIITVGMIGYVYFYLQENKFSLAGLGDPLGGLASIIMAFCIEMSFLFPANGLNTLLPEMAQLEGDWLPANYAETNRRMNYYAKMFFRSIYAIFGTVWVLLLLTRCEDGAPGDCGLVISAWLPFVNVNSKPIRQIFMTLQCLSSAHNGFVACSIAAIYATICNCLVMLLENLQKMFLQIPKLPDRASRKLQIKKCVLYHYKIIEFRNRCTKSASSTFFFIMFFASINISLNSFSLIVMGIRIQMLLHCGIYIFFVIVNNFFGEKLIQASEDLNFTLYQSIPLDGDKLTAKDIRFIMLCSQRGLYMPAGKLGKVGHVRLHDLLSKSYSFLTMLLNTQ